MRAHPPMSLAAARQVAVALLVAAVLAGCGDADPVVSPAPTIDSGLAPRGQTAAGVVTRVVDGDTVHVNVDGRDVTVRMIGINTPETVKPGSPVECFGPEASDYAKQTLSGAAVTLEFDGSQGMQDRYGRTLAYVWRDLPGGGRRLFNLDAVSAGYAFERQYGPSAYAWEREFRTAQQEASSADAGLWGACAP